MDDFLIALSANLTLIGYAIFFAAVLLIMYFKEEKHEAAKRILHKTLQSGSTEPPSLHPVIDPGKCAGCAACTKVCPEGDILQMVNHKAVLTNPTKCVGHGECAVACPFDAIKLVFGSKSRGVDIPNLTPNYETNLPGLYIAGELGGMGLIRNAFKQGNLATEHALEQLRNEGNQTPTDTDLLIVGAGPAGLASSLTAIAQKNNYLCIEQNSFGGIINNFPRQKIVTSHPAELPLMGKMKFPKNRISKEELLDYWNDVRIKTGLKVHESIKFQNITPLDGGFHVTTDRGHVTAKKVILAMGVGGTPRKLGLENEDLEKVCYRLLDPEQYQSQNIAIVGGGNSALEAAQYLSRSQYGNKVTLLVRGSSFDRANSDNIELVEKLWEQGTNLNVMFNSSVTEITKTSLRIETKLEGQSTETASLNNDFLFIFAGAELPYKYLMSLGIKIDKKFGEPLQEAA